MKKENLRAVGRHAADRRGGFGGRAGFSPIWMQMMDGGDSAEASIPRDVR